MIFLISLQMAYAEGVSNTNTSNMGELVLKLNQYNLNTANSWFQPVVIRKKPGNYAFTVSGPVWFTKSSKKWPGAYLDSGGITGNVPFVYCKIYKSPYIKGGKILLGWVGIGVNGTLDTEVTFQTVNFGEVDHNTNIYPLSNEPKNLDVIFNKDKSYLEDI